MEDIMKIVKSLEDSGLLLKGVSEAIQNEVKEHMLLGTLGANLSGKGMNRVRERFIRAGYGSKKIFFNTTLSFN